MRSHCTLRSQILPGIMLPETIIWLDISVFLVRFVNKCNPWMLIIGIGNAVKKEFKEFDIDTASMSSFEVANKLWDMIGEAVDV